MGCEARKIPADVGVFFLDFYLYRTSQDLAIEEFLVLLSEYAYTSPP